MTVAERLVKHCAPLKISTMKSSRSHPTSLLMKKRTNESNTDNMHPLAYIYCAKKVLAPNLWVPIAMQETGMELLTCSIVLAKCS